MITNYRLSENKDVCFDKNGQWHLHRYKVECGNIHIDNRLLYPPNRSIPLLQVLIQINQLTGFLKAFQHKTEHYISTRPRNNIFYAAIIGFGENIGISEMGDISRNMESIKKCGTNCF